MIDGGHLSLDSLLLNLLTPDRTHSTVSPGLAAVGLGWVSEWCLHSQSAKQVCGAFSKACWESRGDAFTAAPS